MVPTHERRQNEVRLGSLNLGNGRAEIRDVEREEVDGNNLAAIILDVFRHPLGGNLPVIVVGGDDIGFLARLLHGGRHELFHGLGRRRAGAEGVAVADAAFVENVVEVRHLEAIECRANGFARGRRDATVHHGYLVLQGQLLGVLGVHLDIRLGVVMHHLDRTADEPARGVDFLDSQVQRVNHGHTGGRQRPGLVVKRTEQNGIFCGKRALTKDGGGGDERG